MELLITICARGGSKGIPKKNIKLLNGKPLIGYTIEIANKFSQIHGSKLAISTDDKEILVIANNFGLFTDYTRPSYLATDTIGKNDVIGDLVKYEENILGKRYKYILDLDVTSPLRTLDDLEQSYQIIKNNTTAYNLFSVSPAFRNPYFNMVEETNDGYCKLIKNGEFLSRQSAPKVFDMNASFEFFNRHYFDTELKSSLTEKSMFYLLPHICFDLDHPTDFDYMSYLLEQNKLDFKIC